MGRSNRMWRRFKWPVTIGVLIISSLAFRQPIEKYFDIAKSLDIFATLFKEVNAYYVDEVDPEKLIRVGIDGMLESLDPYTDYIAEEDMDNFRISTTGQYAGIGALIGIINKRVVITHPYKGFPAYNGGLHVGDEIISINGKNVAGKSTSEISAMLKGQPKTEVQLKTKRPGQRETETRLSRERIVIANVAYAGIIDKDIAYIKLQDFTAGASREVQEALTKLKSNGAKQVILDLRDNPGGLLHEAVNIVSMFIPRGSEVVSTKGKVDSWNKSYKTLNAPVDTSIPVIVLVSEGSASASEIVAGALQDYDRAVLMGTNTFGKGLVQSTRPLSYNAQLKVTTARYYTPSGRCIQALDYAHRKDDGSVVRVADSLKTQFKTRNGRPVFDGGGLDPDVPVKEEDLAAVTTALIVKGMTFDFASRYCADHALPSDLAAWRLPAADYEKFIAFIKEQKFSYTTSIEHEVEEMKEIATREKYQDVMPVLETLTDKIEQTKASDLVRLKEEIKAEVESQIAFHYGLNEGQALNSLNRDATIEQARKLFRDPASFNKILATPDAGAVKP
ncbi:S41 family peptidase [Chryseolinea sp. T2]|uniref:S41 family peptidase n=1 Tax=Chryseolinea sp. T2 TaxID=3129255 RepID=UPI003076C5B4